MAKHEYREGKMLLAVLTLLKDKRDGLSPQDVIKMLPKIFELNEHEKGFYKNGKPRFGYLVRFNTIGASKIGWILKDGTNWKITDAGLDALRKNSTGEQIYKNMAKLYKQFLHKRNLLKKDGYPEEMTGEEVSDEEVSNNISVTFEEAKEQAQEGIEKFLHQMDWQEFQKLVEDLLKAMGYYVDWRAAPGKDGGTDILAYTDPLGIEGPRIKVQVKNQQNPVSEPELKSFVANIGPHDSGVFFCTGNFTKDAQKYARQQENKRIMLVNSEKLVELWIENQNKLSDQAWQKMPLSPIYFLTPED